MTYGVWFNYQTLSGQRSRLEQIEMKGVRDERDIAEALKVKYGSWIQVIALVQDPKWNGWRI